MNSKQAKQIPMQDLLSRLGHQAKKQKNHQLWYLSPFREEKTPSFQVNLSLNTWYDFGTGEGGTIIDFVMEFYKESVKGALERLSQIFYQPVTKPVFSGVGQKIEIENKIKIRKIQELKNPALISYLKGRKINIDYARKYLNEIYYTQNGKDYFSLAFKNDSGGYETRNKYFQGSLSPKDITTINAINGNNLAIFEGFFDFLSYLTIFKINTLKSSIIVLNSINLKNKAVEKIKSLNPAKIYFFLDNDEGGNQTVKYILQKTQIIGVSKNHLYSQYKDLNEWLNRCWEKEKEGCNGKFR